MGLVSVIDGESRHKSNECSKRKQVNVANYEEEDDVLVKIEQKDSDFIKEYVDHVNHVIQNVLCI